MKIIFLLSFDSFRNLFIFPPFASWYSPLFAFPLTPEFLWTRQHASLYIFRWDQHFITNDGSPPGSFYLVPVDSSRRDRSEGYFQRTRLSSVPSLCFFEGSRLAAGRWPLVHPYRPCVRSFYLSFPLVCIPLSLSDTHTARVVEFRVVLVNLSGSCQDH